MKSASKVGGDLRAPRPRRLVPSGIDWIGDIPEGWKTLRVKYLASEGGTLFMDGDWINSDIIEDDGIRYLTSGNVGVGKFKRQGAGYISEDTFAALNCLKAVPGDLMISRLNEPLGRACIIPDDEPYYVIAVDNVILRHDACHDKRYLMYCMSSDRYAKSALIIASGATMQRISRTDLGNLSIPIPPLAEQQAIAAHLDAVCGKIDALKEKIEKEIAALEEYRKSLITKCVTKGLDEREVEKRGGGGQWNSLKVGGDPRAPRDSSPCGAPMKSPSVGGDPRAPRPRRLVPSGIDWIGDIPEGWNVTRLKYEFSLVPGSTPESNMSEYWDGDIPWITPADYKTLQHYVNCGRRNITKAGYDSCSTRMVPAGSLIFSKRAPVGTVAVNTSPLCTNQGCISCVPCEWNCVNYWYYLTSICTEEFVSASAGTTFLEISAQSFGDFSVPIPPLVEQREIAAYLDRKCAAIDAVVAKRRKQLEGLADYRKGMIYAYVTGKKEVAV